MKTLIKMTAFVKEQKETSTLDTEQLDWFNKELDCLNKIRNYANFLSLTPEIWQFVPCKLVDGVWVVLELPKRPWQDSIIEEGLHERYRTELKEYQQAKERCYFEGFEVIEEKFISKIHYYIVFKNLEVAWNYNGKWKLSQGLKTIEDLIPYNLTLTATAKKQIGL